MKQLSIHQARPLIDGWLADIGLAAGPVEIDVHQDDGPIVYASTTEGTIALGFTLPPCFPFDRYEIERFFLGQKQTFEWC